MPADLRSEIKTPQTIEHITPSVPPSEIYDLVCVGGGPAGLTAAIYAARAGLRVLVLEQGAPGGKLLSTAEIENWPGQISAEGRVLAASMEEHAKAAGAEIRWDVVRDIENAEMSVKTLRTMEGEVFARSLILAGGCRERHLGVEGEERFRGMGVSYCAVCDGAFFKDGVIVVVGSGDSAFEEGDYLTRYARKVYILLRSERVHADRVFLERAAANPKIEVRKNRVVKEIRGSDARGVESVLLHNVEDDSCEELLCDAVFPFIGSDPVTDYAKNLGICDERGYILTDENMACSLPGIFAAGDCRRKNLRQVITASNDGAIAAQAAAAYLRELSR